MRRVRGDVQNFDDLPGAQDTGVRAIAGLVSGV
jgi:hypothetical protein